MAKLTGELAFTGTLSNLSAYRRQGSDKIILRMKGGASKEKILSSPSFDLTRRINSEFGGRATTSKYIRQLLFPLLIKDLEKFRNAPLLNLKIKHNDAGAYLIISYKRIFLYCS